MMHGAVIHAPGDVRYEEREDPQIFAPTDAIIRLAATCVCGSDLWDYRGINPVNRPTPMGHEYVGVVEQIGDQVRNVGVGDFVVGSFMAPTTPARSARPATSPAAPTSSSPEPAVPNPSCCAWRTKRAGA